MKYRNLKNGRVTERPAPDSYLDRHPAWVRVNEDTEAATAEDDNNREEQDNGGN